MIAASARLWQEAPLAGRTSGGRLTLREGPIFLVLDLAGAADQVAAAERAACRAFTGLLSSLSQELPALRTPAGPGAPPLTGAVARAMAGAVAPFAPAFITPMAAVAGAVADHVLSAIRAESTLTRAAVNNGGDIALHLGGEARYAIGIHDGRPEGGIVGTVGLAAGDGIGGIATSGWRGRSHSLGIADAVTVLARTAAGADAAATMIANAVDLPGTSGVTRAPARSLSPDSDLGYRLVTVDVAPLAPRDRAQALDSGLALAESCRHRGLIAAAFLCLQGEVRATGGSDRLFDDREGTP